MVEILPRLTASLAERYRIERELGAGGMAIVFLAEDLRHHRKVAVKVLRPELAAILGGARFLKEIQLTANLQHPHILSLFDSGEADGLVWYVMPFVDGESLRERLTREKQLPVEEALRIAREVADALEYAHRQTVVHRDIKPENILLHGGHAQVADFGIALAASRSEGGTRMTETGMSLGTPQYMAPEQAMGEREITPRADVYALGCVLYEMLTGEPPFTGPTAQAIVARVMTEEPRRLTLQRRTVPPHVEAAVETALAKLPADRFGSAAEFAAALATPGYTAATRRVPAAARAGTFPWRRLSGALGVLVAALGVLAGWALARKGGPAVYDVGLPDSAAMLFKDPLTSFAVAPRADFMIYVARLGDSTTQLEYRSLVDLRTRALAGTVGGSVPRLSPDGARVAFVQGGKLKVMPVDGGAPRPLADVSAVRTVEWVSPARLLVVDNDGSALRWIDADAGQVSEARIPYCVEGTWLAGARRLLCGGGAEKYAVLLDPATGKLVPVQAPAEGGAGQTSVLVAGSGFRVVDDRYLVYVSLDGDLRATTLDAGAARAGRSITVVPGVRREAYTGDGQVVVAGGSLVYVPGPNAEIGRMVRVRAGGPPQALPVEPAAFLRWDLSPDGRWLAAAVQNVGRQELRLYDLRDGSHQVWVSGAFVGQPLWSPSGRRLMADVGDSVREAVLSFEPGSASPPETLFTARGTGLETFTPMDWHAEHLVLGNMWDKGLILRFDPLARPVRVDTVLRGAIFPALSPDGRTLAYEPLERGAVQASPYPALDRRIQLAAWGTEPQWVSNTDVLVRRDPSWFRIRVRPGAADLAGVPELWFTDPRFADTPGWSNRVTRDGSLIYLEGPEQTRAAFVRVVPGWVAQMKKAVRAANAR